MIVRRGETTCFMPEVRYEDGEMIIPTGPGWGMDVNEVVLRKHAKT